MAKTRAPKEDRVFVSDGRRHYRRAYSLTEVRIGAVILVLLAAVVGWVAWRGAHPDPELFAESAELLEKGAGDVAPGAVTDESLGAESRNAAPPYASPGAPARGDAHGASDAPGAGEGYDEPAAVPAADRGPLPSPLAPAGWREGPVSSFDPTNLYVKIDGREDYYKTYGFERLHFVTLTGEQDDGLFIDIECFDQGKSENALGAYTGERDPAIAPTSDDGGMSHIDRNALYLTRGRYYIRVLGGDESPAVLAALDALRDTFRRGVAGEELPWAYALFQGELGLPAGKISYEAESAFSFGFARDVYVGLLDDESELFVVRAASPAAATALAGEFNAAFVEYGSPAGSIDGVSFAKDRYLGTLSGAAARESWVLGVRGASDEAAARASMQRLRDAVAALTERTRNP